MTTTSTPLKRALQAAKKAMGPQQYGAAGRVFECGMCGHDQFKVGAYIVLLGMHTLVCCHCSHVEFFESAPQVVE